MSRGTNNERVFGFGVAAPRASGIRTVAGVEARPCVGPNNMLLGCLHTHTHTHTHTLSLSLVHFDAVNDVATLKEWRSLTNTQSGVITDILSCYFSTSNTERMSDVQPPTMDLQFVRPLVDDAGSDVDIEDV
jgi:hypothetical protein